MPLETATYPKQLEPSNPAPTDQLSQADEHLRLIKNVLKTTFPNISGPVTATEAELNTTFSLPVGLIVAWYGTAATVPTGWAICDGKTVARSDGSGNIVLPNLVDRAIIGAGTIAPYSAAVGAATSSVNTGSAGAHSHTIAGGEHTHTVNVQDTATGGSITSTTRVVDGSGQSQALATVSYTAPPAHRHTATAESATHTHTVSSEAAHSHSVQVSTVQPSAGLHWIMKV